MAQSKSDKSLSARDRGWSWRSKKGKKGNNGKSIRRSRIDAYNSLRAKKKAAREKAGAAGGQVTEPEAPAATAATAAAAAAAAAVVAATAVAAAAVPEAEEARAPEEAEEATAPETVEAAAPETEEETAPETGEEPTPETGAGEDTASKTEEEAASKTEEDAASKTEEDAASKEEGAASKEEEEAASMEEDNATPVKEEVKEEEEVAPEEEEIEEAAPTEEEPENEPSVTAAPVEEVALPPGSPLSRGASAAGEALVALVAGVTNMLPEAASEHDSEEGAATASTGTDTTPSYPDDIVTEPSIEAVEQNDAVLLGFYQPILPQEEEDDDDLSKVLDNAVGQVQTFFDEAVGQTMDLLACGSGSSVAPEAAALDAAAPRALGEEPTDTDAEPLWLEYFHRVQAGDVKQLCAVAIEDVDPDPAEEEGPLETVATNDAGAKAGPAGADTGCGTLDLCAEEDSRNDNPADQALIEAEVRQ